MPTPFPPTSGDFCRRFLSGDLGSFEAPAPPPPPPLALLGLLAAAASASAFQWSRVASAPPRCSEWHKFRYHLKGKFETIFNSNFLLFETIFNSNFLRFETNQTPFNAMGQTRVRSACIAPPPTVRGAREAFHLLHFRLGGGGAVFGGGGALVGGGGSSLRRSVVRSFFRLTRIDSSLTS